MKKIIILLIFVIFLGLIINFYNSSNEIVQKEIYNYEELATLPMEKAYTYEEILKDMVLNGLDTERVANFKAQHDLNIKSNSTETVLYSKFAMDSYSFNTFLKRYELTPVFYVGLSYISNGSPDKIISIDCPFIRTSGGVDCVFTGNIFYRLESGNSFYYGVNGNLYKINNTFIRNIDFDGRYYSSSLNT